MRFKVSLWIRQCVLIALLSFPCVASAATIEDDFNDGNDAGWQHYEPLHGFNVGGVGKWTFTNGAYHLQATAATQPATFGSARLGSYRTNTVGDFQVQMDVVDWKTNVDQLFGVFGRMNNAGLGTTEGYAFCYGTMSSTDGHSGQLQIMTIIGEYGTPLSTLDFTLTTGHRYRMVFIGIQAELTGELYDLQDPDTPVAILRLHDETFSGGLVGLFGYDNSLSGRQAIDFTVDNFFAGEPRPKLKLSVDTIAQQVMVAWPGWASGAMLEESVDLHVWTPVEHDVSQEGDNQVYRAALEDLRFYRLVQR